MSSSEPQPELPYVQIQALCQQIQIELRQADKSFDLAAVQTAFRQSFAALTEIEAVQAQPIQVEINKQLRLLEADSRFLSAARQIQTIEHRKQQIQQRLDLLIRYAAAVATLQGAPESASPDQPD